MRVHHLNCISSCLLGGRLMDGRSEGLRGKLACRCVLVEIGSALVLVDTGYGLLDVGNPHRPVESLLPARARSVIHGGADRGLANQRHLRELLRDHKDELRVICSHDPRELEGDSGRPLDVSPPSAHRDLGLHVAP